MKKACKKPCKDCPWKKSSAKGWLGGQSPELFTSMLDLGNFLPCHNTQNKNMTMEEINQSSKLKHCAGALAMLNNSCSKSRNQEIAILQEEVKKDENVFRNKFEFLNHHKSISQYLFTNFKESEEWANFLADEGDDDKARALYEKVEDKPKCLSCGDTCEDIDSYYETYVSSIFSGNGNCIYCCE